MTKKLIFVLVGAILCWNQLTLAKTGEKRLWNLQNADIKAVINAIAQQTKKNFIVDPKVQGKISVVSNTPITSKEAYQLFLSALSVLGYSAIPAEGGTKIVPNIDARTLATPLATPQNPGEGDQLIARVIPIHYVSAIQLVPILRPLMSQWSNIAAYQPSNVIVLAGRASNISRINDIVEQVDKPENSAIEVVSLHHAVASKIVAALNSLQNADRSVGKVSNVSLAADDGSNKILMSGNRSARLKMRVLISQLDTATSSGGNTRVIHLNYIEAKKLAPVLEAIAKTTATSEVKTGQETQSITGQIAIKADEESNSIVISAPAQIMQNLVDVVHKLDAQPNQVLVEAVIAQVNETMLSQLGITWGTDRDSTTSGTSDQGTSSQLLQFPGIGIIQSGDLRAVVAALRDNNSSNILSTPSIVVTDNQKANIAVGKNIGVTNREYSTTNTTNEESTPYNTFSRQNVALSLEVTPHISKDQTIRLLIKQDNDTLENPSNPGNNPIINTNQIKTTVMVNNGNILVLGGLISHNSIKSYSKIPVLGDLPLLGPMFRYKNKTAEKKNLMVFIRPIILKAGKNARQITEQRYNLLRNIQLLKSHGIGVITNINESPILTPITKPKLKLPQPFINYR